MASPVLNLRIPDALRALLEAEAERSGRSKSAVVLEALEAALSPPTAPRGMEGEARPRPAPERQTRAREAAKAAEAQTGVAVTSGVSRARAAMDAAGTVEWDPNAKRAPYQKAARPAPGGRGKR